MQALQPMQIDLSKSTTPSARLNMAAVGRRRHRARALIAPRHLRAPVWYHTDVMFDVGVVTPMGTTFSDLQAVVHVTADATRVDDPPCTRWS
jgi:hypothetical protein